MSEELKFTKMDKCKNHLPDINFATFDIINHCRLKKGEDTTITDSDCESCDKYKSKYIEYPIEVSQVNNNFNKNLKDRMGRKCGMLVKIRPCDEKYENKTFVGIYLGELPIGAYITHDPETKALDIMPDMNPAIFVPDLNEIIYGCASWWGPIKSIEEVQDITDHDIANVWYVKALQSLLPKEEKKDAESES